MSSGGAFPSDWPPCCPPNDAEESDGAVYRITKNNPPTDSDFQSLQEMGRSIRSPTPEKHCQALGLSVYRSRYDPRHHLRLFRRGGDFIAEGMLTPDCGKTMPTPAGDRPSHATWWCLVGVDRRRGFRIIEERADVAS